MSSSHRWNGQEDYHNALITDDFTIMEQSQIIETIGSITKMEQLSSMEKDVLKNSLVLRNINPFPGVRSMNNDLNTKPESIFIILRYRYAPEKINRINSKLLLDINLFRYPSYGEIITHESILPCVRLKELQSHEQIKLIQEYLRQNDLQLMAHFPINAECRIRIFKTFKLAEIGDGLYRDLQDGEKFYIRIQSSLNWKRFDYITKKIKHDLSNPEFDSALGVIYRFTGPENVIRVFDRDISYQRATLLRKLYLKEIKSEIHLSPAHI